MQEGLVIKLNGVDQTLKYRVNTLKGSDILTGRNTCSFAMVDTTNVYRVVVGWQVLIYWNTTLIFGGTVDKVVEKMPLGTTTIFIDVTCVDNNAIADRLLVARDFVTPGQFAGDIVKSIVSTELAGEGLTVTNVANGPLVTQATFNYEKASAAFDKLAALVGMNWYIDYSKNLYFANRGDILAPWNITASSQPIRNAMVTKNRGQYRNRQYLRGGLAITSVLTESFKGNSAQTTFTLGFPVASGAPTITLNAVSKTVGIRGKDTGKDWYWQQGSNQITQDSAGTLLISTDVLAVTYQGNFPIIGIGELQQEQAARAAIEGTTGVYEDVQSDAMVTQVAVAITEVTAFLRQYGSIPTDFEYETDKDGLRAGQIQTVTMPDEQASGSYLLTSVTWDVLQVNVVGATDMLRYKVKGTSGEDVGGWVKFFKQLEKATKYFAVTQNEVVNNIKNPQETVTFSDAVNTVTALDDGTNDPFTTSHVSSASEPTQTWSLVGKSNVGVALP